MPNWNHYDDEEMKKCTDSLKDFCESCESPSGQLFSKRFIDECIDAAADAVNEPWVTIKDDSCVKIKVLKKRAKDSLNESLAAHKEYSEIMLPELPKYQEPKDYDEMVSELKEQLLIAHKIKKVMYTASQEHADFPTREQMITALNNIE